MVHNHQVWNMGSSILSGARSGFFPVKNYPYPGIITRRHRSNEFLSGNHRKGGNGMIKGCTAVDINSKKFSQRKHLMQG